MGAQPEAPPEPAPPAPGAWHHVRSFHRGMVRVGPAGLLTAIATFSPLIGGFVILGLVQRLAPWIRSHGVAGASIYVTSFWIFGGFAIVPTYAYSGLAGWTFGIVRGFWLAMAAFAGAAYLGYAFAGWLAGDRALRVIDEHPKWQAVRRALVGRGFCRTLWIVTLLRLPPMSPFSFVNYVMAIARVPLAPYMLGTLAGLGPRTLAVVMTFANLQQLDFAHPLQNWMRVGGIVLTLIVVYVISRMAQNAIRGITEAEAIG
jgi:uncharacterized membrane protein YdjX (TVP38/TMEM64 family)